MTPAWMHSSFPGAHPALEAITAVLPRLDSARLVLRAPVTGDFEAFSDIFCGPRSIHIGGPLSDADAWLEFCQGAAGWLLRGFGMWTVTDRGTGEVLGFVVLGNEWEDPDPAPELGFFVTEAAEGKGIAREAASAVRDYAFTVLRLPTLASYVATGNARSIALAKRLGGVHEGDHDGCHIFRHLNREAQS